MKKLLTMCSLLSAALIQAAPQIEITRFVNGKDEVVPASAKLEVSQTTRKNNLIDELDVSIANKGTETLLLRLRAKMPAGNAGGNYWDGNEYTREVAKSYAPVLDRHVFPLTSYSDKGQLYAVGFAPHIVASRFERSIEIKDNKATLIFDLFRVLYPGEKLVDTFVSTSFSGDSYVEVVENYHRTYPQWFRPAPGVDKRIYGTGGYLSSDAKLRDYQYEECRRTGFDWEWYYNSYQRSGDYYPSAKYWDNKLGYKQEKSHAKCNIPGTIADWENNHKIRTAAGDKTSALFYYYMQQYCNTELLKDFKDARWKDAKGKNGYRVKGWADEFWAEYIWPGQAGSFGKKTRADLAKLWKNLTISGFSLDCAIGTTPYYGNLVKEEPFRAYDKDGKIFVLEGVALAYNMDYTRNLPLRPDGRRAGSLVNAPYNYLSIFHADGEMHEAAAWERIDLPVPHRLMLGKKPWYLWRGFVLAPYLDWTKLKDQEINSAISGAVDYLILFSLRMGASPSKMFMRGYPDMLEAKPLITKLNTAGWNAAPFAWVDGMAGKDDPWGLKNRFWLSRYGEKDEMYIVLSNPRREIGKGTLRIFGNKFGATGAVFADITGKETTNRIENGETLIDFELPPFGYLVLKQTSAQKTGTVVAILPQEKPQYAMIPANDSWVEALPLSDDTKGALAAIVGKKDEVAKLDYLITSLSTYSAFHRGRIRVPAPRLWHLIGTFHKRFHFPILERSQKKTIFAIGQTARKKYFPGVEQSDAIVYRQENGRHFVGFFPGKMSEAQLLKAFLFRLDKAYPFVAGTMSDWPSKLNSADKAFRKNQPSLKDALVHPAFGKRFALNADEIALARRDGKLFLRTRFSDTDDLVTELLIGRNGQFEFGQSRRIPAGLGVTSDNMLTGTQVYAAVDESTPVMTTYGNIAANHGALTALTITVKAHGFTVADIGKAKLLSRNRNYYILQIIDQNTLLVMSENIGQNKIGYFDRTTMRTEFEYNGKKYQISNLIHTQLYPNVRITKQELKIDGKALPEGEFIIRGKKLVCDETYEVISPASLLDNVLKNPGKTPNLVAPELKGALELNNVYTFTPDGTAYIQQKYRFLEKTALRQLGLVQTQIIGIPSRNPFREYIIPKAKSFKQDNKIYDFSKGVDTTQKLPRIYFSPANIANPANLPERFIQSAGRNDAKLGKIRETGLVIGYSLTTGASRPEIRKNTAAKMPIWINITQKSYPYVIYSQGGIIYEPGTTIECSGYRKFFDPNKFGNKAYASYTITENGQKLLYMHFSEACTVDIPANFTEIVEKSPGITISNGKITATDDGCWIVMK